MSDENKKQSTKDAIKARRLELLNDELPNARLAMLELHKEAQEIGAVDDYKPSLLHIVNAGGEEGTTLGTLAEVLADVTKLGKARKELGVKAYKDEKGVEHMGAGLITEEKVGQAVVIKAVAGK